MKTIDMTLDMPYRAYEPDHKTDELIMCFKYVKNYLKELPSKVQLVIQHSKPRSQKAYEVRIHPDFPSHRNLFYVDGEEVGVYLELRKIIREYMGENNCKTVYCYFKKLS